MSNAKDMVNHPGHYQAANGLEAWDVIKAFTADLTGAEAWGTQQALKYLLRWKKKNGKEDLKKAVVYIEELIKDIEKDEEFEREFGKFMNPPEEVKEECSDCQHLNDNNSDACMNCSKIMEDGEGIENRFVVNDRSKYRRYSVSNDN